MSFISRRVFSLAAVRRQPSSSRSFFSWTDKSGPKQSIEEISKQTGVPVDLVEDPKLHMLYMKTGLLLDTLGIKEGEEEKKFLSSVVISPGYSTMEWCWPAPPPIHTYEELPLVKQVEESGHH